MIIILIILLVIIFIWLSIYSNIKLYDTIYFGPNDDQVVVINKTLFNVTISFIHSKPIKISLLEFILNYYLVY